jgi:hypothetical protein
MAAAHSLDTAYLPTTVDEQIKQQAMVINLKLLCKQGFKLIELPKYLSGIKKILLSTILTKLIFNLFLNKK